jgi:hypothetical protein
MLDFHLLELPHHEAELSCPRCPVAGADPSSERFLELQTPITLRSTRGAPSGAERIGLSLLHSASSS